MAEDEEDQDQDVPLQDLRPFYRSRPRQEITFIPARSTLDEVGLSTFSTDRVSDSYLDIVLKNRSKPSENPKAEILAPGGPSKSAAESLCPVCRLPLNGSTAEPHNASLAHQVCLTHSHPPSHLDRKHIGMRYLASHGWDPDSRRGLGADGRTGIRAPIKAVEKKNTAGLGLTINNKNAVPLLPRKETLDAGKVRKHYAEERKKTEKLREMFYGDDKIARYFGEQ